MNLHEAISLISEGDDLSTTQSEEVMAILMGGEATQAQIGALLMGLHVKGETVEEITGFARKMRELATPVTTSRRPLVDTCGTGGDHSGSFNISTTAAFVVAGAGVAVAKHGNRSATSQCGSADVLEALGVNIELSAGDVGTCIDELGIGFLYARTLHGSMKHVAGARGEIRIRTVFNLLGPLTNPASATGQVIGVFDPSRVEDMAEVLTNLGTEHAFVVAGEDGLDELTLGAKTFVAETCKGKLKSYELVPEDVGLSRAPKESLLGGNAERNAEILRSVLTGDKGPPRDSVLYNAAAALQAGEAAADWATGIEIAAASIDSGAALDKLEQLISKTNKM